MLLLSRPSYIFYVFLFLCNLSYSWPGNRIDIGPIALNFLFNNSKIQKILTAESLFFKSVATYLKFAKIYPELI